MDSESTKQIPKIDLSVKMERGSKEWDDVCKRVKDACEDYGCFEVVYDPISTQLRDEIFLIIRQFFQVSLEIKKKNNNPKPYHGYDYAGLNPMGPLYESFGIEDASNHDALKHFAQLFISDPLAQLHFCKMLGNMVKAVNEVHDMIRKLIHDSLGVGDQAGSTICNTLLRLIKHSCPPSDASEEDHLQLYAHTHKLVCTLICEDQVSGSLEIQTKKNIDGQWTPWIPSPNSFLFMVGDPLMAWSNGRLHAVKHRVMMKGDKDRYSVEAFLVPTEGTLIKPPKQLIDQNHPQIFREFDFMKFLNFSFSTEGMAIDSPKQLFAFLGI
ncbi:2-oxoglutarate (2OG) and Fe(II)-dependent oxygenase superfamily protein [Euphorbia peplus]|nr:2-oxoglutarate (2OG) and Fe(II)-dependent oxygenase superfamily protein [Euphorbia peplus]